MTSATHNEINASFEFPQSERFAAEIILDSFLMVNIWMRVIGACNNGRGYYNGTTDAQRKGGPLRIGFSVDKGTHPLN